MAGLALVAALLAAATAPGAEDARKVLAAARCSRCHDSAVSRENPRALAIYDLHEKDWPASLSDVQLPKLLGRLRGAPATDREIVRRFVEAELRRRR